MTTLKNTYQQSQQIHISPKKQRILHISYWHCAGYTEKLYDSATPHLHIHTKT